MKNLFVFYLLILVPFGIILWLNKADLIDGMTFAGLLLFYVLIYRTFTGGKKLADKNIIAKKDIWKMIIPGNRLQYFKELYLK